MRSKARDHHVVPQFYLRNFAVDPEKRKIATLAKHGPFIIWSVRSIERTGFERDFYVHMSNGAPVSVEEAINKNVETPLSRTDTWAKIVSGRADALDSSDKPALYALIRHLEVRNPHYLATAAELSRMAADPNSEIPFTAEERQQFAEMRADPNFARAHFNYSAATAHWTEEAYAGAAIAIFRSPIPVRSSTTPAIAITAPADNRLRLSLPGMKPYQHLVALDQTTIASLVLGDFGEGFLNVEIEEEAARGFNRHYLAHFCYFPVVRHLITGREGLVEEMQWANYEVIEDTARSIKFRKRAGF